MAKIVINFNNLKVLEINYDIAHGAKTTEHPFAHNSRNKFFATTTTTATKPYSGAFDLARPIKPALMCTTSWL